MAHDLMETGGDASAHADTIHHDEERRALWIARAYRLGLGENLTPAEVTDRHILGKDAARCPCPEFRAEFGRGRREALAKKLADAATSCASEVAWTICGYPSTAPKTPQQIAAARRLVEFYRDDAEADPLTFTSQLFEILADLIPDGEEH